MKQIQKNYGKRANDYPGENENKWTITQVLQSEVARYASILAFILPLVFFIYQIKLDIALIKQNHFTHIEQLTKDQTELKVEQLELQKQVIELQKQSLVILEKLSK